MTTRIFIYFFKSKEILFADYPKNKKVHVIFEFAFICFCHTFNVHNTYRIKRDVDFVKT